MYHELGHLRLYGRNPAVEWLIDPAIAVLYLPKAFLKALDAI
jgi:hypothetical protein